MKQTFQFLTGLLLAALSVLCSWANAATPAVPLGVEMTANSADSITLAWYRSANNDATAWNVYSSDTAEGVYVHITTVTERTATVGK